jgi:lipoate-protein ligase A
LGRAEYKVQGGKLIKVQLALQDGKISRIKITGDFFLHPEDVIEEIEEALKGHVLDEEELSRLIEKVLEDRGAVSLGAGPRDFAKCIMLAGEGNG